MNYKAGYIRVFNSKKVEEKLGIYSNFRENEDKILKIENGSISYKDENTENFYKKYKDELNSFNMEKLKKIYDKTEVCFYRVIRCLKCKKDICGLCVKPTSILYWWYDEDNVRREYYKDASGYKLKRKKLDKLIEKELEDEDHSYRDSGKYDEFFVDVEYVTFADELSKDKNGVYVVNNGNKEYVIKMDGALRDQVCCKKS